MAEERLNILLSAFFCEPNKGSEAGVGWNFAKNMAKFHNIYVLTKQSNSTLINEELNKSPIEGLYFLYYEVPQNRFFNEKTLGEQTYYLIWQVLVYKRFKTACKNVKFDIIHHLTFNQYRSPSIGFYSKIPFIMGPFGGAELVNSVFFQDLGFKSRLKEKWRSIGLDRHFFGLLAKFRNNTKTYVFSCKQNFDNLKQYVDTNSKSLIIPAIAIDLEDFNMFIDNNINPEVRPFTIIYAGIARDWKGLHFFLKSISRTFNQNDNVVIKLIGIKNIKENQEVSGWIEKYGLTKMVELIDFMPRSQLITEMQHANLFVYPAFRDSGSMSVIEACALGCPVLCLAAGGQDVFPDDVLLRVAVSDISYEDNLRRFSDNLQWAYKNKAEIAVIGKTARSYVFDNFTWAKKVANFCKLYSDIVTENKVTFN